MNPRKKTLTEAVSTLHGRTSTTKKPDPPQHITILQTRTWNYNESKDTLNLLSSTAIEAGGSIDKN
jgi:hypothetical protein